MIGEKLETILAVTIITILIWLYAEGENIKPYLNHSVQIKFVAPEGQDLAIEPHEPVRIVMRFEASSGQYQYVQQLTKNTLEIVVTDKLSDSPFQTVVLKDILAASKLGDLGIINIEATPATMKIRVEPIVSREMEIVLNPTDLLDIQFAQPPAIDPLKIPVRLPASLAEKTNGYKLIANLDELEMSKLEVNVPHTMPVPLHLPLVMEDKFVSLSQPTTTVTFTIRKQTDTISLTSIPIHINAPPMLLKRYNIDLPEEQMVVRDVKLSGPSDIMEKIRTNQIKVWAELRPTADELESGIESAPLSIVVPPGVAVDSALPRVQLKVMPRE